MTVTVNGKQMTLKEYNNLITESQMTFSKDIIVESNPLTLKESHQLALKNQIQTQEDIVNELKTRNSRPEIEPIVNRIANKIAGIEGKGDLSTKPHPRALNPDFTLETAKVFRFGQNKHGIDNFRTMTDEASGEIWDALQRHLLAYQTGETHATDSNLHHLAHAAANLHMLFRLIKRHGDDKVLKIISGGDIK